MGRSFLEKCTNLLPLNITKRAAMASEIQSVVSKLNLEMERQLLQLFPRPVRLHLLYQYSYDLRLSTLQGRLDNVGQFIIIVYLKRGDVRGAYFGKDKAKYQQWFLFDLTSKKATSIPNQSEGETNTDLWVFGNAMKLREELYLNGTYKNSSVDFSSDEQYNTGWAEESMNSKDGSLQLLELYRVHEVGDVLMYPWRKMVWEESAREALRESFVTHKMTIESLKSARVLLLGPAGAGKSSFINSIRSVVYGRVLHLPIAGIAPDGFTKKLKSSILRVGRGGPAMSLTLCEVMAVGEDEFSDLRLSDALAVVKGHVPEGHRMGTPFSCNTAGYISNPGMKDKIHCVLFVLDACNISTYSVDLQKTIRKFQVEISDLDVPQIVLLTHVDQVCHAVEEDVKYVYSSRIIKEKMQKAADFMGMPLSYVLPVKNYSSELSTNCTSDILLLSAVHSILQAVDDTLDDCVSTTAG